MTWWVTEEKESGTGGFGSCETHGLRGNENWEFCHQELAVSAKLNLKDDDNTELSPSQHRVEYLSRQPKNRWWSEFSPTQVQLQAQSVEAGLKPARIIALITRHASDGHPLATMPTSPFLLHPAISLPNVLQLARETAANKAAKACARATRRGWSLGPGVSLVEGGNRIATNPPSRIVRAEIMVTIQFNDWDIVLLHLGPTLKITRAIMYNLQDSQALVRARLGNSTDADNFNLEAYWFWQGSGTA
ncbi:hypothetical protein DFH06DRAFT_1132537 [Mycena polygramma]|nr:hypothetical protein DFH06DRAFT_1132537 [Mycena polygramma]